MPCLRWAQFGRKAGVVLPLGAEGVGGARDGHFGGFMGEGGALVRVVVMGVGVGLGVGAGG